uniref:NADH dehydrogenase subunit 6 n=1 Tax=Duplodicodrilus schmardae TaxID=320986 RepID=A0A142AG15_9ANNE|nr:NADH dehydrogenase subunit 6 [Duplodicodrilus schmardae]AMO27026.1 NADH dehydrogenase subunit 6 [Duplodicodrilus schmardae]
MLLTMYVLMIITSTMMLYLSTTPFMFMINILAMALLAASTLAASLSTWYGFLVILIYIGGMLVMFAYFLALCPNHQLPTTSNTIFMFLTFATLTIATIITKTKIFIPKEMHQGKMYLYASNTTPILFLLALILFLTMVIVVKLTSRSKGPLRPFN